MKIKNKNRGKKVALATLAAMANMSTKTARKYLRKSKLPSELTKPREHRTRTDPFAEHMGIISKMIEDAPELQAKTLLYHLMELYPNHYNESHLRSLQRRVMGIKINSSSNKDVIFPQDIQPGLQSQSDWFSMDGMKITIAGEAFPHLLFHFMLPYSRWEDIMICSSESFDTLSKGYTQAVSRLGGSLGEHRTDNLSAATKVGGGSRVFTDRWQQFMDHYGVAPSRNNPGESHENGSVEKSHDLLRGSINQHLILRGFRDFADMNSYQNFLTWVIEKRNNTGSRNERLKIELAFLKPLPKRHWNDPQIIDVRVSPSSTISILGVAYSVPSRLISYSLRANIYPEYFDLYYGNTKLETIERITDSALKNKIDYRHIIDSLVRKAGAFRHYQYREALFPSLLFRKAYDELVANNPANGHKDYLKILQMAKCYGEGKVIAALERCAMLRALPTAASIEVLFKAEKEKDKAAATAPAATIFIPAPNLSEYDHLYNLSRVA